MESSETLRCPLKEKKINRTNLAYIAGMLDGEGSIYVRIVRDKDYYPQVSIANTNQKVLFWIKNLCNGKINKAHNGSKRGPVYVWRPASRDLKWFLKLMIPFLIIKQRQARLALVLRHMVEVKSKIIRKEKIAIEIKRLNTI